MAGFVDWIIENLQIATIATMIITALIIDTEFSLLMKTMGVAFIASFLITCVVRLVSIIIYNIRLAE